jgi:hypothetical protein
VKIRGTLRTTASAQQIWDYVSEPNNDPKWINVTQVIDVLGNGPNMEFSFHQVWGKTETWGTAKVTCWSEPSILIWAVEDNFRRSQVTYEIKNGLFRQTNDTKFKGKRWLEPLFYPFISMQMRKQLRMLSRRLKESSNSLH